MNFEIKKSPWPALYQFLTVIGVCFVLVWLCKTQSFFFYPLVLLFIGNRIYDLSLIGHEATHGLIFKSASANLLFARYFCYFPVLSSQSHYSQLHFLHHRFAGSPQDPDLLIYSESWQSPTEWLQKKTVELLNGKIWAVFLTYFAGFPQFFKKIMCFKKNQIKFS
jgi:fatty acid desaturase